MAGFASEPTKSDSSTKRYLLCNAQAVSRSTYSALFSAIGTTYGTGDGSSTFNLPDLQGRTAIGSGSGSGLSSRSLGATGGFETTQSGSNLGSGSDFSNSLMQPFTVVNFFIATGL
jgi:microcystin-dependent protein